MKELDLSQKYSDAPSKSYLIITRDLFEMWVHEHLHDEVAKTIIELSPAEAALVSMELADKLKIFKSTEAIQLRMKIVEHSNRKNNDI